MDWMCHSEDCHKQYGPDTGRFKFCRSFPMVSPCCLFSFCSTQVILQKWHNYTTTYHANDHTLAFSYTPFISFMCPRLQSVASISTGSAPIDSDHNCGIVCQHLSENIFFSLSQAVGNIRLKYSHSTSLVWLTQHVSPGRKGCVLPEGRQAACQLWDLPLYISDSFPDGRHQVSANSAHWNECLVLSVCPVSFWWIRPKTFAHIIWFDILLLCQHLLVKVQATKLQRFRCAHNMNWWKSLVVRVDVL